ncbi:MAG: LptF/LptG family permease [Verrucomicrobiales bacterium]|nr:LptF/LptG family permease [Verrucomicrobiales bacterium]
MILRIFDRYIGRQVGLATLTGVVVLSGVMVLGNVYKKLDQLLGGTDLPLAFVLKFIGLVIPFSLTFTIPWAFLTSILLVFGRMSADNELVSLRMTGWSMPRICLPVFLLAAILSAVCFWVNVDVAPTAKNRMKTLFYEQATEDPASLFQAGKVLERFPGFRIYTGKREGNHLEDLHIVRLDGLRTASTIRAKSGELVIDPGVVDFQLQLDGAVMESPDYGEDGSIRGSMFTELKSTVFVFPLSKLKEKLERVNASMMSTDELWTAVGAGESNGVPVEPSLKSEFVTELNKRYSFSLACLTFALVGIPLGVTAQRRETSVGFALSLVTALVYMGFIIFGDIVSGDPGKYPQLLMWLPNVLFLGIGSVLFYRLSRK